MDISVLPLEPSGSRQDPSVALTFYTLTPLKYSSAHHRLHMPNACATRTLIRQQRQALSCTQQRLAAQQLCLRISRHPSFRKANRITAYIASEGEISLAPLIKLAHKQGKACYLPVIKKRPVIDRAETTTLIMRFSLFAPHSKLITRRFGLLEPQKTCLITLNKIDLILCPLVAFDQQGNRIGMGGGFYDRALSRVPRVRKKRIWGVAHRLQQHPITPAPWDITLDGVFTDNGVFTAQKD